jgi:hypothetical protein
MPNKGVGYMETVVIAIIVFSLGLLVVNEFFLKEEKPKEDVTKEDRLRIQVNALENRIKAFELIEQRFQEIETKVKSLSESLDHTQNIAENGDNFMKANEAEIKNLKNVTEIIKSKLNQIETKSNKVAETINVRLEEFKKPILAQIQQTRAQRPVQVVWKKHQDEKGNLHWVMTDKTVEYSRAEYLKKLKRKTKNAKQ